MSYSVSEVARMAGVTVRTLHHYDEIGLLRPSGRTEARYRLYGDADVDRLQEILFYRELGFSLDTIATLLDDPTVDARAHLVRQRGLLADRMDRIEALVAAIDRSLEAHRMGYELSAQEKLEIFTHLYSGKVRDIYEIDAEQLLFVASDRLSAFDVVMAELIPDKGRVLTAMTVFWLGQLSGVAPSHLVTADPAELPAEAAEIGGVAGRAMVVRRAEMLPIECIVRGHLTGSAWKEYQRSGTMHGAPLPAGLLESARLPQPVFTPSTKTETGHDENISFDEAVALVGAEVAEAAREISVQAYLRGAEWAAERGVIIADTKFELGWIDGELALCDEVLTPDSSRFWPADQWVPGTTPPSFDKQPVRDWLEARGWDKTPPPPALPADVIAATSARYVEGYERITGRRFADWYGG
jgi:phosphoribosylaminoimidazole-succinocarboxamide synthase